VPAAAHFARVREPKVLVTTCYKPSKTMFTFLAEMLVRSSSAATAAESNMAAAWRQQHIA
jgi:hypothetical protein